MFTLIYYIGNQIKANKQIVILFSILVLRAPCPACFRGFPAPTHLIQMNRSLSGLSRARWWGDHLNQVCWCQEMSKTCREGAWWPGLKNTVSLIRKRLNISKYKYIQYLHASKYTCMCLISDTQVLLVWMTLKEYFDTIIFTFTQVWL